MVQPVFQIVRERFAGGLSADQRCHGPDHAKDFGDRSLIEDDDVVTAANEFGGDLCLQIREAENQVWLQRLDLVEPRIDERRYLGLAACLRWSHGVTGDPDDAIAFAEEVQRLGCFFGQADDPRRISRFCHLVANRQPLITNRQPPNRQPPTASSRASEQRDAILRSCDI